MENQNLKIEIIQDIASLYELSLSIGHSWDVRSNCEKFLHVLMSRKDLEFASLWVKNELIGQVGDQNYSLVYANPETRIRETFLPEKHPILQAVFEKKFLLCSDQDELFPSLITEERIQKGTYAIFALEGLGFLKLFSARPSSNLTHYELNKLNKVIQNFAISIKAALYHQRSIQEAQQRLKTEEQYTLLFHQNPNAMCIYSLENRQILAVNDTMITNYGYSREEFMKMKVNQLFPIHEKFQATIQEEVHNLRNGSLHQAQTMHRLKNGAEIHVSIEAKPIEFDGQEAGLKLIQDITEAKQREEKIKMLARFPDENPYPVLRIAMDATLLYANQACEPILNLWKTQVGKKIPTRIFKKVTHSSHSDHKEIKLMVSERIYSLTFNLVSSEQYYNVYGKDITESKKVERAIKESEAKTRTIINSALDAVILIDRKSHVTEWNEQAEVIFGWKTPEAIGKPLSELIIPPQYRSMHNRGMEHYLKTGVGPVLKQRIEITALRRTGEEFPVELTILPVVIRGEAFFSAFVRDISERKAAEEQIRLLKEWINQVSDAVQVSDLEGNLVFVNEESSKRMGYSVDELLEMNVRDIEEIFKEEGSWEKHVQELKNKGNLIIEGTNIKRDGTRFPVEVNVKHVESAGGAYIVAFSRDITQRKKAERELILAKERAEEAASAKQQFLSTVSHEIRTPMNAILGMSRLLEKTNLADKQREYLNAVKTSAKNLLVIINDILDTSKIEAGKLELDIVGFRLEEVLRNILKATKYKAEEKGIGLFSQIDSRIAHVLMGDSVRLNQILLNLINNAIKFTNQGYVRIDAKLISARPRLNLIEFQITDTGKGIHPDKLSTIFDSFTQEDATINRKYGGTGLGLSISKQLIELFGGSIQVKSQIGRGTTFYFTIPFRVGTESDLQQAEETDLSVTLLEGLSVLLVEDNEMNQLYACTILEEWGTRVTVAGDGKAALEALNHTEVDIILMDMQLPVMNGLEASRAIRDELKSTIPIIALTANAIKGDNERCLQAGMNDYISKPFEPAHLFQKMAQLTRNADRKVLSLPIGTMQGEPAPLPTTLSKPSTPKIFDLSQLEKNFNGNTKFIQKVLKVFHKETPQLVGQLNQSLAQQDWQSVSRVAHKLKSSVGLMGIHVISHEIQNLDNYEDHDFSATEMAAMVHKIDQVCREVLQQIEQYLAVSVE